MSLSSEQTEKVVIEEIKNLPEKVKRKNEYLCYCLRSVTARARTYFGTTHDLVHRLRQHNGVIKGGARATSTTRPWRVALVVRGFSDRSAALRFEWFCKQKHSFGAYSAALADGANSIERRAALIAAAAAKCPNEKDLEYCYFDPYLEECCGSGENPNNGVCVVLFQKPSDTLTRQENVTD